MTFRNKNSKTIVVSGIIATIAVLFMSSVGNLNAITPQAIIDEIANKAAPTVPNAFTFLLPADAVDGSRYRSVTNGGIPESSISQGHSSVLPLIVKSISEDPVTINFYTTYGPQRDVALVNPPGVDVQVAPSKVTLQPGEQATINVIVRVDPNAPDGLYQQQIVGEWGGVNEFLGTGIDVKIGKGATEFMIPSGVNNNG